MKDRPRLKMKSRGSATPQEVCRMLSKLDKAANHHESARRSLLLCQSRSDSTACCRPDGFFNVPSGGRALTVSLSSRHVVGMLAPGKKASVVLYRKGKIKKLNIEIGALEGGKEAVASRGDGSDRIGLVVEDLSERELSSLGIRGGVMIEQLSADSAASESGLRRGDIILQLGYSRIDDVDEYEQVVRELPTDTPVLIRFYRQGRAISRTIIIKP